MSVMNEWGEKNFEQEEMTSKKHWDLSNPLKFLIDKGTAEFSYGTWFLFKYHQRLEAYLLNITEILAVYLLNVWSSEAGWGKRNC